MQYAPRITKRRQGRSIGKCTGTCKLLWQTRNPCCKKGKKPEFDFSERNDRVTLKLEVGQVVYIPEAVDLQTNRQSDSTEADEIRNMNKGQRVMHYLKTMIVFQHNRQWNRQMII